MTSKINCTEVSMSLFFVMLYGWGISSMGLIHPHFSRARRSFFNDVLSSGKNVDFPSFSRNI